MRFFAKVKEADTWLRKKGDDYRAAAPERRKKQLEKAEHKLKLQKVKQQMVESKSAVGVSRAKLQTARQRARPQVQMGLMGHQTSAFQRPAHAPTPAKKTKKRSKKKKKR